MACNHRFLEFLTPNRIGLEFLFIGTFNPEFQAENDNNADYFYGRKTNQFWCLLPHSIEKNCLIDKGKYEWEKFANDNNIGFSDIVRCITNADLSHTELLTKGFNDDKLEIKKDGDFIFDFEFNTTEIKNLIYNNRNSLAGVYFTRSTEGKIKRIWSQWDIIVNHCKTLNIYSKGLVTPSPKFGNIKDKIELWKLELRNGRQNKILVK